MVPCTRPTCGRRGRESSNNALISDGAIPRTISAALYASNLGAVEGVEDKNIYKLALGSNLAAADNIGPVDIVFTWVNGADPVWIAQFQSSVGRTPEGPRFRDFDQIRFALRSVWTKLPWFRRIYLVVSNKQTQRPTWLQDYDRLQVVEHAEIWPDSSKLPTFSSPCIEANLHRIPGLSERFLYLNDDMMIGRPMAKGEFFNSHGDAVVVSDGLWSAVPKEFQGGAFFGSVKHVDELMDARFGPNPGRVVLRHGPLPVKRSVLLALQQDFHAAYETMLASPLVRKSSDIQFQHCYVWYMQEKRDASGVLAYRPTVKQSRGQTLWLTDDQKLMLEAFTALKNSPPAYFTMQDHFNIDASPTDEFLSFMGNALSELEPEAAPWEREVVQIPERA